MKTQKVEIELPVFEDWEFVRLGKLTESELESDDIGMLSFGTEINPPHICPSEAYANFSHCFIYKRKKPRKIIFEEAGFDFPSGGDFFVAHDGKICYYNAPESSPKLTTKRSILKKIHDDFEVNND